MTTFVTSFIILENVVKPLSWRIEKFLDIVKTGINICVYVGFSVEDEILEIASQYPNVKLMKTFCIVDLFAYKACAGIYNLELPHTNNVNKDTKEYMIMMNAKIEFVNETMKQNPFNTDYFAWIDFSISHVFSSKNYINLLNDINSMKYETRFLAIPGCNNKIMNREDGNTELCDELQSICWRFCGGFFWGDKNSLVEFYNLYIDYFPKFILKYNKLVWEVNFWAWLELNSDWCPDWYLADHNDSIIEVPYTLTSTSIKSISNEIVYDYPIEDGLFVPSSASYVRFRGQHILNTRYVNYTIKDERFVCHNPHSIITSKNVMSILDERLIPVNYTIIDDPPKVMDNLMTYNGIEDIRLYEKNGNIHFIGTSMSHSCNGNNLIVSGIYNHNDMKMEECSTILSPNNSWCEKNWTPMITQNSELIVYKWSPMEMFKIVNNEPRVNSLEKVFEYKIKNDIFRKFRGSTTFTRFGDNLLGLVHFSEGHNLARKYFHALILIDGETLKPIRYSNNFYFSEEPGIEFCTGFAIINMKYQFWISVLDGKPSNVSVNIDLIPLCNEVLFTES